MFYFLQSNTRYFVNHLERFKCHYIYIYIYIYMFMYVIVIDFYVSKDFTYTDLRQTVIIIIIVCQMINTVSDDKHSTCLSSFMY